MHIIYGQRSLLCFTSAHKHLLMSRDRTSVNAKAISKILWQQFETVFDLFDPVCKSVTAQ